MRLLVPSEVFFRQFSSDPFAIKLQHGEEAGEGELLVVQEVLKKLPGQTTQGYHLRRCHVPVGGDHRQAVPWYSHHESLVSTLTSTYVEIH